MTFSSYQFARALFASSGNGCSKPARARNVVGQATALAVTAAALVSLSGGAAKAIDVGSAKATLVAGVEDTDTPKSNATVRIFSGGVSCTGTGSVAKFMLQPAMGSTRPALPNSA